VAEDVSERVLLQAGDILVVSNKRCLHAWDRGGRRRHRAAEGAVAQHVRQPRGELLAVARGAVRPPPSATGPGSAWGEGGDGASPPRLSWALGQRPGRFCGYCVAPPGSAGLAAPLRPPLRERFYFRSVPSPAP
ncbi:unnamed protein product, partial [Prorocentrum cordatum]